MTRFKSMSTVGELKKKSRTRNIKILLRAQFCSEDSMVGVSRSQGRSGASSVSVQFFLAFLSFPKRGGGGQQKTLSLYILRELAIKSDY